MSKEKKYKVARTIRLNDGEKQYVDLLKRMGDDLTDQRRMQQQMFKKMDNELVNLIKSYKSEVWEVYKALYPEIKGAYLEDTRDGQILVMMPIQNNPNEPDELSKDG